MIRRDEGFTLVEVMVSLMICTSVVIAALTIIGQATEDVIDTVEQRKMRYLVQNILGDVKKGPFIPNAPEETREEFYEEGQSGDFNDFASSFDPNEYERFGWEIPVFRDEVIVGAPDDETLQEMGFLRDENGNVSGRPVTNDPEQFEPGAGGLGGENTEEIQASPGQIKRVLVFNVVRYAEDEADYRTFTVMIYLPHPDEEQQQLGEGAEGGGEPGTAGGDEAGAGAGATRTGANSGSGSDRGK